MLRRFGLLLRALFLAAIVAVAPSLAAEPSPRLPQSVLWIGNSFTYYNGGIPAMVKALAEDLNPLGMQRLRVGIKAIGGAHLPDHAKRPNLGLDSSWDIVILQGYSDEPINPEKTAAFRQALVTLAANIRAGGAKTLLFMTWAYKDRPSMTQALAVAYADAGIAVGAPVVPVGLAFARAQTKRPELALVVTEDNKHPSVAGTYLAACTFYAWLFGSSPEQAAFKPKDLTDGDAAFLQRIAWETFSAYPAPLSPPASARGG